MLEKTDNFICLRKLIEDFHSDIPREREDKLVMLKSLDEEPDILLRDNLARHFTASSWIVNEQHDKILCVYHNIYDSWAWTGGHADGEADLLAVALREAKEETGLKRVKPLSVSPLSLEILAVKEHIKNGQIIPAHEHFNCTFLLEASEKERLSVNTKENSGVAWLGFNDLISYCREAHMIPVYKKIHKKFLGYTRSTKNAKNTDPLPPATSRQPFSGCGV